MILTKLKEFLDSNIDNDYLLEPIETSFGTIIGAGQYSAAIELYYDLIPSIIKKTLKEPILIITLEKEKMNLVQSVLGKDSIYEIDISKNREKDLRGWLDCHEFETEEEALENGFEFVWSEYNYSIEPVLEFLESEGDLSFFFIEKGEPIDFSKNELVEEVIEYFDSYFPESAIYSSTIEEYLEPLCLEEAKEDLKEKIFFNEENIEEAIEILSIIKRDLIKMSKAESINGKLVSLDIHNQQFLNLNNEIYLIDAFIL